MKRFWETASVVRHGDFFAVRLDGRPMRLPGGPELALQSEPLADAIAAEWQAAGQNFTAEDLPLTRLAGTAQERVAREPAATADALARYGASDLLCYRAERPAELVARQARFWQPWLDWAARAFGAELAVGSGVMPVSQPAAALAVLRRVVGDYPPFVLAGLGILVPATGSLVLGLAATEGLLDADTLCALAFLDEDFEIEHWGEDREALARRALVCADVLLGLRFIAFCRAGGDGTSAQVFLH